MQKTALMKIIENKVEQIDKDLGLHDNQIDVIKHLVTTTFGLSQCSLDIHYKEKPKRIVLFALDNNGNRVGFKPKHSELLEKMLMFLDIKGYEMTFWSDK